MLEDMLQAFKTSYGILSKKFRFHYILFKTQKYQSSLVILLISILGYYWVYFLFYKYSTKVRQRTQQIFTVLHILPYVLKAKGTSESLGFVNQNKCVRAVEVLVD